MKTRYIILLSCLVVVLGIVCKIYESTQAAVVAFCVACLALSGICNNAEKWLNKDNMNKALVLHEEFMQAFLESGVNRETANKLSKKAVLVMVKEIEKIIPDVKYHSVEWWSYLLNEIREDVGEL